MGQDALLGEGEAASPASVCPSAWKDVVGPSDRREDQGGLPRIDDHLMDGMQGNPEVAMVGQQAGSLVQPLADAIVVGTASVVGVSVPEQAGNDLVEGESGGAALHAWRASTLPDWYQPKRAVGRSSWDPVLHGWDGSHDAGSAARTPISMFLVPISPTLSPAQAGSPLRVLQGSDRRLD